MKKLYSQKDGLWIKLPRQLYKALANKLAEDQIAEFYLSFERYLQNQEKTVKDVKEIITAITCMGALVASETFLSDVNSHSDQDGNIDWKELLKLYEQSDINGGIRVIYRS